MGEAQGPEPGPKGREPKKRWCETCGEQPEAFVTYRLCRRCLRVAIRVWIAVVKSGRLRKVARR